MQDRSTLAAAVTLPKADPTTDFQAKSIFPGDNGAPRSSSARAPGMALEISRIGSLDPIIRRAPDPCVGFTAAGRIAGRGGIRL